MMNDVCTYLQIQKASKIENGCHVIIYIHGPCLCYDLEIKIFFQNEIVQCQSSKLAKT
jgi:hypothetical protein